MIRFTISLTFGYLLYKYKKIDAKINLRYWVYLFIFSFFLYDSLEFILGRILFFNELMFQDIYLLRMIFNIITLLMSINIAISLLKEREILILITVFIGSYLSMFLWFRYIGPTILPMN